MWLKFYPFQCFNLVLCILSKFVTAFWLINVQCHEKYPIRCQGFFCLYMYIRVPVGYRKIKVPWYIMVFGWAPRFIPQCSGILLSLKNILNVDYLHVDSLTTCHQNWTKLTGCELQNTDLIFTKYTQFSAFRLSFRSLKLKSSVQHCNWVEFGNCGSMYMYFYFFNINYLVRYVIIIMWKQSFKANIN